MARCEVKFDNNPSAIYSAGQTVSGQLELTIPKLMIVKGVSLNIVGYAKCRWEETELRAHGYHSRVYKCSENYVSFSMNLVKPEKEEKTVELAPGTYFYTFTYDLPEDIPTSFEGSIGHIRYNVVVILEIPWKFDQKFKTPFTVLKPFDLNTNAGILSLPSENTVNDNLSFGPFKTGPICITANTPQSGYVPGETIIVRADIKNSSSVKINEIRFYLQQIIRYIAQKPKLKIKEKATTIAEARVACLEQNQQGKFSQYLQIPSLPPTTSLTLCQVLQISYEVKVEARVSGIYRNPEVKIPITLGTVPLRDTAFTIPVVNSDSTIGLRMNQANGTTSHRDLPPPSYEECVVGIDQAQVSDDEEEDVTTVLSCTNYAPRYPVYNCGEWHNGNINNTT